MSPTCKHADHLLCFRCLAARWGINTDTLSNRKAAGLVPKPNLFPDQARGWLWHVTTIAAFERGEPVPMWPKSEDAASKKHPRLEAIDGGAA